MKALRLISIVAAALSAAPALAGPCTSEIESMQKLADQRLDNAAGAGPTAAELTDAKLHHQPTVQSLEQAETQVGDLKPGTAVDYQDAMGRARAADDLGDAAGCRAALADLAKILKP